jgi:hypothetical protein
MSKQAQERSRAGAYRVRALAGALALALGGVLAMPAAVAGPNDGPGRRDDRGQQNQQRRDFRDSRWGDAADPRSFEARAEEQRRIMQENANNAEMTRRMSRMTPDERRDLRRQINEASQEVYSVTPRR